MRERVKELRSVFAFRVLSRERKLASHLAHRAGACVQSDGKGWRNSLTASLEGFRADVRYEAAGAPLGW